MRVFGFVISLGYKLRIKWPKNGTFRPIRDLEEGVFLLKYSKETERILHITDLLDFPIFRESAHFW